MSIRYPLLNRELGILGFNERVLAQAADPAVPLLERLRFICITLAMGPLSKLLKAPVIIRYRRRVGLWAFTYVCLHLSTYLGVDQLFDWPTIGKDIAKRPYITIGMAAFTLLIPMAVTSLDRLRRRIGPHRWKRL